MHRVPKSPNNANLDLIEIFIWNNLSLSHQDSNIPFQVVQEYERSVIFRLGRLRAGGAKGPGIFFILPCIDSYKKVDLRTVSFDVPPQEVLSRDRSVGSVSRRKFKKRYLF